MQITNLLVLGAALGAIAAPSGHSHLHRSAHEKRAAPVFYKAAHSKVGIPAKTSAPAPPPPAPTTASAAPAAASSAAPAAAVPSFCSGVSKRATQADIFAAGNLGRPGQYACNIMVVDNSVADKFDYTAAFTNVDDQPYVVSCGLKIGPDGTSVNGFWSDPVSFPLAPGETKTVAYEADTQAWCGFNPGTVADKTPIGQFAGTWLEVDMGSSRNGGHSGADCSSLVAAAAGMRISGCHACDLTTPNPDTCSTIWNTGAGRNAFPAGTEAEDGHGINANPGPLALSVQVGYNGP